MTVYRFTIPGQPETWLPVPRFEGSYEVSDLGRIRSLARRVKRHDGFYQSYPGTILSQTVGSHGYPAVALCFGGKRGRTTTVHSIVAEAFLGPRPAGFDIRHLNGNRQDPRLINLQYGTKSENQRDRVRHDTHSHGVRNASSKLCPDAVSQIRMQVAGGRSYRSLAADYGISDTTLRDAAIGKTWADVV